MKTERHGEVLLGVPILGDDNLLPGLKQQGIRRFFVGVGSVGNPAARMRLYELGVR